MHLSQLSILILMQLADTVAARPVSLKLINARRTEGYTANEDRPLERLAVVLICIVLAFLLALSLGYRAGRLAGQRSKTRGSDILVFVQGFFCTAFLFIVAVLAAGLGLETKRQCFVAIRICLASYGLTKMTLYLFLFERVHIVRASFLDRRRDPIYVIGVLLTTCGFIAIASWQYTDPMAEISAQDGRCRIGPKHDSAIAIITVDTFISLILTGIFVWQLRPAVSSPLPEMPSMTSTLSKTTDAPTRGPKSWVKRVRKIIWGFNLSELQAMVLRNIVGSTIMLGCTLFNNVIFLTHDWSKVGQACMLLCLSDVIIGMVVTQWLTMRQAVQERSPSRPSIATYPLAIPASCTGTENSGRSLPSSSGLYGEILAPVGGVAIGASPLKVP